MLRPLLQPLTKTEPSRDSPWASKVRAALPVAIDYKHIHFGVWAALGAAEKSGSQELSDLGIGFVQSIGDGLTGADMPNNGTANYSGSWVAAVQAEEEDGNGVISLMQYGKRRLGRRT